MKENLNWGYFFVLFLLLFVLFQSSNIDTIEPDHSLFSKIVQLKDVEQHPWPLPTS